MAAVDRYENVMEFLESILTSKVLRREDIGLFIQLQVKLARVPRIG